MDASEEHKHVKENQEEESVSRLQRAGTMDVTALEGIQLLHREGVSVEETADHLRSGQTFKNIQEPDSSQTINTDENDGALEEEQEGAEAVPLEDNGEAVEEAAPTDEVEAQESAAVDQIVVDDDNENGVDNDAPISISSEEADPPSKEATLQRTLTIADTIEQSKEILGDEELGKTRSADPAPDKDSEDGGKDEVAEPDTPEASSPDSTKPKMRSALKKTPTMIATIQAAKVVLGRESLGRTRSQDRKRSLKSASDSSRKSPRKSTDGTPVSKRRKR
eukprot:Seg2369.2 transcript_id=Seg2369.2/GoldUCD/mRNA.D3Y31 product="hypothetical protein" protein_id=Seg2369.2/GoldUCD/D3Y31